MFIVFLISMFTILDLTWINEQLKWSENFCGGVSYHCRYMLIGHGTRRLSNLYLFNLYSFDKLLHQPLGTVLLISREFILCIRIVQESIPIVKAERVRREMLRGAEIALGLPEGSMPAPFFTKVQLWYAKIQVCYIFLVAGVMTCLRGFADKSVLVIYLNFYCVC